MTNVSYLTLDLSIGPVTVTRLVLGPTGASLICLLAEFHLYCVFIITVL